MPFEKSAGAIIFYKGKDGIIKYLLLQHENDYWNFPKGRVESGETEIATVRREIKEEAGITKIKIILDFKNWYKYFYRAPKDSPEIKKRGKAIFKIVIFYLAQALNKKVKISREHENYGWLPYEEALKKLKYKNSREILKKVHEFLQKNDRF